MTEGEGQEDPGEGVLTAAIFGSADGLNTGLGIVFGQGHLFLAFVLLLSMVGALSMAQGQFVSALRSPHRSALAALPAAVGMGVAMFLATLLPDLPALAFGISGATRAGSVVIGTALAVLIGYVDARGSDLPAWQAYGLSIGSYAFVTVPTVIFSLATGIGG